MPELATCPITEGTLLRLLIREGQTAADAMEVLDVLRLQQWHTSWPDEIRYESTHLNGVIGHRQVTDADLVALAKNSGGKVATLDRGPAVIHGDAVQLLAD